MPKQNRWDCLLYAFQLATGRSREELLEHIGHDGSEKISDKPEPWCRRAFHPTELMYAVFKLGHSTTMIEVAPIGMYGHEARPINLKFDPLDVLKDNFGVVTTDKHAWFFDGVDYVVDPDTDYESNIGEIKDEIRCIFVIN